MRSIKPSYPPELWQSYCEIKAHLKVLSKVVMDGNQSAALQFAIQTEGILEEIEKKVDNH